MLVTGFVGGGSSGVFERVLFLELDRFELIVGFVIY